MPNPIPPEEGPAERELQYHANTICRNGSWQDYPPRLVVTPPNHLWSCMFPPYYPPIYCSNERNPVQPPDPLPRNPFGKTGLGGRGCLPEYGANATTHLIITRRKPKSRTIQVCTISDPRAEWQSLRARRLPPGLPSKWNPAWKGYQNPVHDGYVDDVCNTDNAWFSTTATHIHIPLHRGTPRFRQLMSRLGRVRWIDVPRNGIVPNLRNPGLVAAAVEMFEQQRRHLRDSLWALQATVGTLIICSLIAVVEEPTVVFLMIPGVMWILVVIILTKIQLRRLQ